MINYKVKTCHNFSFNNSYAESIALIRPWVFHYQPTHLLAGRRKYKQIRVIYNKIVHRVPSSDLRYDDGRHFRSPQVEFNRLERAVCRLVVLRGRVDAARVAAAVQRAHERVPGTRTAVVVRKLAHRVPQVRTAGLDVVVVLRYFTTCNKSILHIM